MTPDDLELIAADAQHLYGGAENFAAVFYDTLFEISPSVRPMFPDDLTSQQSLLSNELAFLIDAATNTSDSESNDVFVERARDLGRRHAGLGVKHADYAAVELALVAVVRACVPTWDESHNSAWTALIRVVGDLMRDGADRATLPSSPPASP